MNRTKHQGKRTKLDFAGEPNSLVELKAIEMTYQMQKDEKSKENQDKVAEANANLAKANASKAEAETKKLNAEALMAEDSRKEELLMRRQRLRSAGIPQEEIDQLFPL